MNHWRAIGVSLILMATVFSRDGSYRGARPGWKDPPLDQPIRVLIVDGEASQRSELAAMVSAWGMTARTANDGQDAMVRLSEFPADVIITELNMPGLDGFGLLQKLHDSGRMPPVIVLTAYGSIETAVKTVHELGAYWHLEKPVQPATLERLLRRQRRWNRELSFRTSLHPDQRSSGAGESCPRGQRFAAARRSISD